MWASAIHIEYFEVPSKIVSLKYKLDKYNIRPSVQVNFKILLHQYCYGVGCAVAVGAHRFPN